MAGSCRHCTAPTWESSESPVQVGAYVLEAAGLYLWHPDLCPACRTEWPPTNCHLCGAQVQPKTWEVLGYDPPPWDALTGEVERLAGRVMVERRVSLVELEIALRQEDLGPRQWHTAEDLVRAYAAGSSRAAQKRFDDLARK